MAPDSLIASPGRLRILAALAGQDPQEFIHLRQATRLTDGNLSTHARRLESAGLLRIDKSLRQRKLVTSYRLTSAGRDALRAHVDSLQAALNPLPAPPVSEPSDDWVD